MTEALLGVALGALAVLAYVLRVQRRREQAMEQGERSFRQSEQHPSTQPRPQVKIDSVDGGAGLSFDVEYELEPPVDDARKELRGNGLAAPESSAPLAASAYARMACPSTVVVEQEFDLEIGLADRPTRGVIAQPLRLPDRPAYRLTVQIIVDGFTLRAEEQPRVELEVTPDEPYPTATLHLTAKADAELGSIRSILAVFSVDGHPVGSATRAVEVVTSPEEVPADAQRAPATGVDTSVPATVQSADLTITISLGDDIEGRRLMWSYQSPHGGVSGSPEPLVSTLGSMPNQFARSLMRTAGLVQGEALERFIAGKAKRIAEVMPIEIRAALRAAAVAACGPPSVLLLSADPYVPWELARIDSPWLAEAPAILGAQTLVGRWALRTTGPTPEPPRSVAMQTMAVVRGLYDGVFGFKRLMFAEKEAEYLQASYGAAVVEASQSPFFACLDGEPPADVLHFAMHGKFGHFEVQDGLILVDGVVVEPDMILGADLARHPFVFLNACQVGQAGETLGQYGGMAQAFVEAGASAVIAPLWVVNDDVAQDVSLRFYAEVFSGKTPAEFLRAERARDGTGTHLAYVLYGHPLMRITRSARKSGNDDAG